VVKTSLFGTVKKTTHNQLRKGQAKNFKGGEKGIRGKKGVTLDPVQKKKKKRKRGYSRDRRPVPLDDRGEKN